MFLRVKMSGQSKEHSKQVLEQKQLWEINDVILNENYRQEKIDSGMRCTLMTSRGDLPVAFSDVERDLAMVEREEAEALVYSPGIAAQNIRHAGGTDDPNYKLPSQRAADADTPQ
ncbi:hypothetical protein F4811DRAFT_541449 [Daldinia bambusicola]|nr:hypothetical protein F4811DRAFT_541449 [Daldinia bambusicola]